MSNSRGHSPTSPPSPHRHDLMMEGVAANVKLLLKIIDDYNHSPRDSDNRRPQRVVGMIGILDDIKSRIEKSQLVAARREADLRRCNTDLRRSTPSTTPASSTPKERRPLEPLIGENHKLRKELAASHAARKSLERMFSSLGKEKEIMAAELARKAHELNEMEELVSDLKAQNEMLLEKVKLCATEHRGRLSDASDTMEGSAELKERNDDLAKKLLRSLDAYRVLKRKFRDVQEECTQMNGRMMKMTEEVSVGLERIHHLQQRVVTKGESPKKIAEELSSLEHLLQGRREQM